MHRAADPSPAFRILGPQPPQRPVVLAVPHAGRAYGADLIAAARVPLPVLQRLEDRRADLLVNAAVAAGYTAIIADAPRALIDLNRAETDCDPVAIAGRVDGLLPSQRARGGLGLLPHRLHPEGELWHSRPDATEYARRLATVHRPWHAAISALLGAIRARGARAVLLDIHSMPAPPDGVEIALGDRYGLTARSELADRLLAVAEGHGLIACRNHPYAGAFGIERHAAPARGIEAVQVEISRACYLDADGAVSAQGAERMAALVAALADAAGAISDVGGFAIAAE